MTDTAELIAELLAEVRSDGDVIAGPSDLDRRAADALSSLVRERDEARKVLRDHHKWHAESGVLGIPDGDGGWIEMDNGAEYADSRLCQRTEAAISGMSPEVVVPPRGGWSMGSNHWENWQLAYRQKRAAEARATAAEANAARMREALEELEAASDALAATRSPQTYLSMIDNDRATDALNRLDAARKRARASLSNTSEGGKDAV